MFRKFLVMALVAVAAAIAVPSVSQAGFSITLTSAQQVGLPASPVEIIDLFPGSAVAATSAPFLDQADLTKGVITLGIQNPRNPLVFAGLQIFLTSISTAPIGNPPIGSTVESTTQTQIRNTSGSAVTLTIFVNDNTFEQPTSGDFLLTNVVTVSQISGIGSSFSSTARFTDPNSTVNTPVIATTVGTFQERSVIFNRNSGATFTLANTIVVTLGINGVINFQSNLDVAQATPAPAGLLLAAFGIPAFGLLRRIGRKSGAAQVAV